MAKDAIDVAVEGLGGVVPDSVTDQLPILGAKGYRVLWNGRARSAARSGLPTPQIERLLGRYGARIGELLGLVARDSALGEPLPGAEEYLRADDVRRLPRGCATPGGRAEPAYQDLLRGA